MEERNGVIIYKLKYVLFFLKASSVFYWGKKKQKEIINLIRKKKRTNTTLITGLNFQTLHTYIRTHSTVFH